MDKPQNSLDLWRIPILVLWMAFFAVGLYPEWVYDQTREIGHVAIQRAMINSAWLVTLAWAGYLAWFTLVRCREAGDSHAAAGAKGVQILLLGLTAFLPLRLENIAEYQYIPVFEYRWLLFGMISAKGVAWFYLVLIILRYYLFSGYRTFTDMPALFPSAHETAGNPGEAPNDEMGAGVLDGQKHISSPPDTGRTQGADRTDGNPET